MSNSINLESSIKDVISRKLEDGTIEKLIEEELEKGVKNALNNLFRSYGDVTEIIEKQIKSVMVPYLENYDYSNYIVKLDEVLQDVLENSALENKKLLTNFQQLMIEDEEKEVKVTDIFNAWMKFVAANVDTSDLDINYDDEPSYEEVNARFEIEESERWGSFQYATLILECEQDEKMNFSIQLYRWTGRSNENWDLRYDKTPEIKSLRSLSDFEIYLLKLSQSHSNIIIDSRFDEDSVRPDAEPEASFS